MLHQNVRSFLKKLAFLCGLFGFFFLSASCSSGDQSLIGNPEPAVKRKQNSTNGQGTPVIIPNGASLDQNPVLPTNGSLQQLAPNFTNGIGGETGDVEREFRDSQGLNSKFHMDVPTDISPNKPYGLLVYCHGDGGQDYQWFFEGNASIAKSHNLIGVTVYSPNRGEAWYGDDKHTLFLHELLQQEIYKKYNIDMNRVYFAGASGGSEFLSGMFIPSYGKYYKGASVHMCGGFAPWDGEFSPPEDFKQGFKLYYYAQTGDFLYEGAKRASEFYSGKGMQVISHFPSGGSHCGFDLNDILSQAMNELQ